MQVKTCDRIYQAAPAQAEPADSVVTADFYTQLPQIRMTGTSTGHRMEPETTAEVMLDGDDVAKLVECAIRHPAMNMRYAVLAAIWNHPDSSGVFFSSVLKHPSLSLKYGRSLPKSLPNARLRLDLSLGRGQAGPRDATASDAAAGASTRSREELVEARCCNRHRGLESHWSHSTSDWGQLPLPSLAG